MSRCVDSGLSTQYIEKQATLVTVIIMLFVQLNEWLIQKETNGIDITFINIGCISPRVFDVFRQSLSKLEFIDKWRVT
ncbi:hypothetical protein VCRA2113O118_30294 [Vibrio crassostreae]|nr:hypothetical protein VCRA2113O118_30294 [Vibrio crassostreae]CAK3007054.1 hypothetical protein VCRA2119O125_50272 [Vibrio crassostreae]CAK3585753.1 hypothetical protein VCRA2121O127_40233 [Vibrio crassostreae]CAK3596083.1 hypothetical protein VCRA2122O128_40275 [Vibrio crassostreae]